MGDISQNDQAETSETVDGDVITAADVASLNGIAVARAAAFCRIAGTVVVVVGLVGAVSWLWLAVRTQQRIDGGGGSDLSFESARPSLVERVDY